MTGINFGLNYDQLTRGETEILNNQKKREEY